MGILPSGTEKRIIGVNFPTQVSGLVLGKFMICRLSAEKEQSLVKNRFVIWKILEIKVRRVSHFPGPR